MRSVPSSLAGLRAGTRTGAIVGPFADRLLAIDLPALDPGHRGQVVAFTVGRVENMPSTTRVGVMTIALLVRLAMAAPGGGSVVAFLARHPLPLLGEYVRLVRSLGYTFVWEHWPDTRPDGGLL